MDLQTMSGKPVSSENAISANNFRPYSPQTTAKIRLQPDTPGEQFAVTTSRHYLGPTVVQGVPRGQTVGDSAGA